ncbi:hypothetical protein CEXT_19641 [Caerostris extrusa]|uniref:Uncharacterized protein n=1 Tax=Caerostris extrusa TaxID=172846 RepID=A0AAV4TKN5_CAEEX|nr:hypothetical protein CEXT_19641 [Caerostris extrusa]
MAQKPNLIVCTNLICPCHLEIIRTIPLPTLHSKFRCKPPRIAPGYATRVLEQSAVSPICVYSCEMELNWSASIRVAPRTRTAVRLV